jgi:uncharacterized iron-regulated membrane protein
MTVVLLALGIALVGLGVFAILMYLGWRREQRKLTALKARSRRLRDPQVDEDHRVKAVKARLGAKP